MTDPYVYLPVNAWFVRGVIYHDEMQAHDIAFKHGAEVFQCFRRIANPDLKAQDDQATA